MIKNSRIQSDLADLGLKSDEITVYLLLIVGNGLTAKDIADQQGVIVNSVYRSTRGLVDKGLVVELDTGPKLYQAVPPSSGIVQLANKKTEALNSLSESLLKQISFQTNPNSLNMDILTGRKELFRRFVELAESSKQEILVISIGESVPEAIWDVTRDALSRGVKPKYLFHKHDKDNILLIKRWLTMGVDVRHLPAEGYHLNIIDHTAAILSASNPKQSKERTGVLIYNQAIIEVFRGYFYDQWQLAKPLSIISK